LNAGMPDITLLPLGRLFFMPNILLIAPY